ncbi:uncharacterized protein LOC117344825 [Pecten maximus]|uniref:uncharacterized protein LOC117344825 n=1 Tax=Pecten maximus TaxID=6579 RepID=UPI0014584294|nr:uncharacterized protein LOC117344825 [Pecten maximus]
MEDKAKTHLSTVAMAIFVRLLLVFHTVLATWRVTLAWDDLQYWLMSLGVLLVCLEGYVTIRVNKGIEWKWLCPCFAIYLIITLPSIWLLEISQMNKYMESQAVVTASAVNVTLTPTTVQPTASIATRMLTTTISSTRSSNVTAVMATTTLNISDIVNVTMATAASNISDILNVSMSTSTTNALAMLNVSMTTTPFPVNTSDIITSTVPMTTTTPAGIIANIENLLGSFSADTWVVIVEESLVYLIVIGRWLLPRGRVTREELSDLLIDYLAMASDIMELFALFDEDLIRGNAMITYAILTIWSVSFIQFIPVVMNRRAVNTFRKHTKDEKSKDSCCVCAGCGDSFPDIFVTIAGLFLQDGPFLALRLFIIFYFQLLTYSLVFFVLKNVIVVLLLTYRLGILCVHLPCCSRKRTTQKRVKVEEIDDPIHYGSPDIMSTKNGSYSNDNEIIHNDHHDQSAFRERYYREGKKTKDSQNGHDRSISYGEHLVHGHPTSGLGVRSGSIPLNIRSIGNTGYPVRGRDLNSNVPRKTGNSNGREAVKNQQFRPPNNTAIINSPVKGDSPCDRPSASNGSPHSNGHHLGNLPKDRVLARSTEFISSPDIGASAENRSRYASCERLDTCNDRESKRLRTVIR